MKVILSFCFLMFSIGVHAENIEAVKSAEEWIGLVDSEKYEESWKTAASYFKSHVSMKEWEKMAGATRKPLGKLISRKKKSVTPATTLPGAPDGKYEVIQFESSFENKKQATEMITPMLDKDKKWRVSGYVIR